MKEDGFVAILFFCIKVKSTIFNLVSTISAALHFLPL